MKSVTKEFFETRASYNILKKELNLSRYYLYNYKRNDIIYRKRKKMKDIQFLYIYFTTSKNSENNSGR